jgi:hypothetical protein
MPAFDGPTLYTALREQLGLQLESAKGPVEAHVIEHLEKAAANRSSVASLGPWALLLGITRNSPRGLIVRRFPLDAIDHQDGH